MCLRLLSLCFTLLVLSLSVKTFNATRAQVVDIFVIFSGKISFKTIIFTPLGSPDWIWACLYPKVTQIWCFHCWLKLDLHLSMTHVVRLSYSGADSLLPGPTGKPLKPPHSPLCVRVCVCVCVCVCVSLRKTVVNWGINVPFLQFVTALAFFFHPQR